MKHTPGSGERLLYAKPANFKRPRETSVDTLGKLRFLVQVQSGVAVHVRRGRESENENTLTSAIRSGECSQRNFWYLCDVWFCNYDITRMW